MKTLRLFQQSIGFVLMLASLVGYDRMQAQPRSGDWKVSTAFGELVFTVDSAGALINKIIFRFSNWTCGPITRGGGSVTTSWPSGRGIQISNRQFTYETYFDISPLTRNEKMTINGTFNQTGDVASGTWSAVNYGTTCSGAWGPVGPVVSVGGSDDGIPERFDLEQNFPNPFNSTTNIRFVLAADRYVTLGVFDLHGKEVAMLINRRLQAGRFHVLWDATDAPSGVYLFRLHAGSFVATRKTLLVK
ncbi:MAG TPA: hypothetical protein DCP63_04545 [Bacteroidetes bacterium]|nr:hypothetical protein [Bacteroidota bacterium]